MNAQNGTYKNVHVQKYKFKFISSMKIKGKVGINWTNICSHNVVAYIQPFLFSHFELVQIQHGFTTGTIRYRGQAASTWGSLHSNWVTLVSLAWAVPFCTFC